MKKSVFLVMFALLTPACGGGAKSQVTPTLMLGPGTAALRATVHGVKLGGGPLYCALFNSATHFPGSSPIIGGHVSAAASAESLPCSYEQLPEGDYAISTFQDENENGVLDTNVFGQPTEGYGATNNHLPDLSAPTFADSKIHLADGTIIMADINLKN